MYNETSRKRVILAIAFCAALLPHGAALYAKTRDALIEYRSGNYQAAAAICREEIEADPSNIESYIVLCWSLLKLGAYNEASIHAEAAAKFARYDARLIEILGEIEYFQGRNARALQYFQQYINSATPEGQRIDTVYYYIGEIYIRLGRFKHADIAISTALHYDPNIALWWSRLAYAREMSGDYGEAFRAYTKALEINSALADAARGLERTRAALNNR
ncbi:MAG: tetratricopeptide repeat protein [Spirochaetaceae bacterium]|jgi:tetratricopeptide (TPR) repeat protein|nr:tetratricopeptide repeat protein [Spirochaetaceae bacterium]